MLRGVFPSCARTGEVRRKTIVPASAQKFQTNLRCGAQGVQSQICTTVLPQCNGADRPALLAARAHTWRTRATSSSSAIAYREPQDRDHNFSRSTSAESPAALPQRRGRT